MNAPEVKVSIIIPVYNRWDLTEQCLQNLKGSTQVPHEIIVVDNASIDGTPGRIMSEWPDVRLIRNAENKNFSGACNQGAEIARGEILVFLNNDTIPFEGWLEPMVDEFDKYSDVGVVGSKLIFPDDTIQHAGVCFMRELRFAYHPYRGSRADHPFVSHRRELQVVTGACLAIRSLLFAPAGKFNPEYKNGGEDIELCLKVRKLGFKVVYQPASVLVHLESQSPGRLDANDNNINVFFKNFPTDLLADEDWFYFQDGLRRSGHRQVSYSTNVVPIENEINFKAWKVLSDFQHASFHIGNEENAAKIMADTDAWPLDASIREWAALVAKRSGDFKSSSEHFLMALRLNNIIAQQKAVHDIHENVILAPQFNHYFTK